MREQAIALVGKKFNLLTVLSVSHQNKFNQTVLLCLCDCGSMTTGISTAIKRGTKKSCGCIKSAGISTANKTHGMSNTRIYRTWAKMIQRCSNESKDSHIYLLKGITFDPSWGKFENFYNDMKDGYDDTKTIDRIDNDLGYTKENCRWATRLEQSRNKSTNLKINYGGVVAPLSVHAENHGLNRHIVWFRYKKAGWSLHDALTTPSKCPTKRTKGIRKRR